MIIGATVNLVNAAGETVASLETDDFGEFRFKEIADLTGVSINSALGRMRYAILNMRRMAEENHMELSLA